MSQVSSRITLGSLRKKITRIYVYESRCWEYRDEIGTNSKYRGPVTGAVPAMKPEATAIGDPQEGRWKITLSFDGRRFCVPKFRH